MSDPVFGEGEAARLAGETDVAAPSPAARERARIAFVEGRVASGRRPPLVVRVLFPVAAAAMVLLSLWLGGRPASSWIVLEGVDVRSAEGRSLGRGDRFSSATVLAAGAVGADVQLGTALRVRMPAGARVELPEGPGRWLGRTRRLRVLDGEIFATSGGRPLDFELIVESPETRTRIHGTTFAVRRNGLGTCVCLLEGRIVVESPERAHSVDVPVGMRVQFYAEGQEPMTAPLADDERARLEALGETGLAAAP
jgi:ferric-dicitrate binding protein FerR (iron transport regulator)